MVRDNYKNWLKEAEWDLETAKILKDKGRFNNCAFYAQQSVEKLLKSALIYMNESPWGHSASKLLLRLDEITDEDYSKLHHNALDLDIHYIPSRYPNAHPDSAPHEVYDKIMAEDALTNADIIFDKIKILIKEENNNQH